jgi:hypothetical protein
MLGDLAGGMIGWNTWLSVCYAGAGTLIHVRRAGLSPPRWVRHSAVLLASTVERRAGDWWRLDPSGRAWAARKSRRACEFTMPTRGCRAVVWMPPRRTEAYLRGRWSTRTIVDAARTTSPASQHALPTLPGAGGTLLYAPLMVQIVLRIRLVGGERMDVTFEASERVTEEQVIDHVVSTLAQEAGVLQTRHGDRLVILYSRGVAAIEVAPRGAVL